MIAIVDYGMGNLRSVLNAFERVAPGAARLTADPAHVLARGWSIVRRSDGRVVRSVADVEVGTELAVRFGDGTLHATVGRVDHDGAP